MTEKLKDIKETASDVVEIIRELSSPDVQESLDKIKEVAKIAREIIESLKDPAIIANVENLRKTSESIEKTGARIEKITGDLKNSGILDGAQEIMNSAKNTINSLGYMKNMGETVDAVKEMLRAISELVNEMKLTVEASRKYGIIRDTEETIRETRGLLGERKSTTSE